MNRSIGRISRCFLLILAFLGAGSSALCRAEGAAIAEVLSSTADRIEAHRKGDAVLTLMLPNGDALEPGALVKIEQTRHAFLFGANIFCLNLFSADAQNEAYANRFAELLNFATLPFYWWDYERSPGQPNDARSEEIIRWCKAHAITTKGHPLAWNWMEPAWLPDDPERVLALQFARIERCIQRFADDIVLWDVVNEATHYDRRTTSEQAPKLTEAITSMGRGEYLRKAFTAARSANPDAVLIINDYRMDQAYEQRVLAELVDKNKTPRYDVIGLQSHMHDGYWGAEKLWKTCERYAKYGKPLHFTEVTVLSGASQGKKAPGAWSSNPEGEARQAKEVAELYTLLFSHPAVEAITWWDLSDHDAWQGAPAGLLREDLSPKPAYTALMGLIKKAWWTHLSVAAEQGGAIRFRGFYGEYRATAEVDGQRYTATFALKKNTASPIALRLE